MRSPLVQETNLKGPVPTGLSFSPSGFSRRALGLAIAKGTMAMSCRNEACTLFRTNLTVYSSTTITSWMFESSSKPPNM